MEMSSTTDWEKVCNCAGHLHPSHLSLFFIIFLPFWWKKVQTQLPSYMIPKIIVRIDKIPVTPIGKVNKRALPM